MASKFSRHNLTTSKLHWLNLVIILLLFLLPTNLFLSLFKEQAYVTGIFSDYLIIKIYLSEIFLWLYITSILFIAKTALREWMRQRIAINVPKPKTLVLLLLVVFALVFRQFWTEHPLVGLWAVFQWLEVILLTLCMLLHFSLNQKMFKQVLIIGLSGTILFQSVIGFAQFVHQRSVLGFSLLGEPLLTNAFNIDRFTNSSGVSLILPYGTTAHPNVLGGYLAVYSVLLLGLLEARKRTQKICLLLLVSSAFILVIITHSLTALSTAIVGCVIVFAVYKYQIVSLTYASRYRQFWGSGLSSLTIIVTPILLFLLPIILPTSTSIIRRNWLQLAAARMTIQNPLLGTGLNQFVTKLTLFTENTDVWRFLQPVHSVPWLFLSETGFLGILILYMIWHILPTSTKTTLLLTTTLLVAPICLDHYLLSLQPSRWLWSVTFIGLFVLSKNLKKLQR